MGRLVWSSLPGAALAVAAATGVVSESVALSLFAVSFVGLNLMHMGATWARVYVPGMASSPVERLWIPIAPGRLRRELRVHRRRGALARHRSTSSASITRSCRTTGSTGRLSAAVAARSTHVSTGGVPSAARRGAAVSRRHGAATAIPARCCHRRRSRGCRGHGGGRCAGAGGVCLARMAGAPARRAGRSDRHRLLFGTNLTWSALLVFIPHPAIPLFALASGHYIQYLYFVWRVEQRTPAIAASSRCGIDCNRRCARIACDT